MSQVRERRVVVRSSVVLGGLLAFLAAGSALASSRGPYSMEILLDGQPVEEYSGRGKTYVEARRGREYAVRLTNRTAERIAVALSVDGLNSIDAKESSARDAAKWILAPWESIVIDGWQTSSSTARRFFFTSEERSYGAWLGKTRNLGVVSAAFFRERRPEPIALGKDYVEGGMEAAAAPSAAPRCANEKLSRDAAATGIGREVDHRVVRVEFEEEDEPASVVTLRYEYRDALARLGVLPAPWGPDDDVLPRRERSRGFDDFDFAPDPYRAGPRR